ncbi:hypothetical protein L9F63_002925, partial [Diploptera punctata]
AALMLIYTGIVLTRQVSHACYTHLSRRLPGLPGEILNLLEILHVGYIKSQFAFQTKCLEQTAPGSPISRLIYPVSLIHLSTDVIVPIILTNNYNTTIIIVLFSIHYNKSIFTGGTEGTFYCFRRVINFPELNSRTLFIRRFTNKRTSCRRLHLYQLKNYLHVLLYTTLAVLQEKEGECRAMKSTGGFEKLSGVLCSLLGGNRLDQICRKVSPFSLVCNK